MLKKDEALCIRTVDYSETSQVVTVFCRDSGKVGAIAKGARRKKSSFGGAIEIFSYGPVVFTEPISGKLATLTEFDQRGRFRALNKNLFALNCSLLAIELLDALTTEADPHPQLFDGFVEFLDNVQLAKEKKEALAFLVLFELGLLQEAGIRPVFEMCVNCKKAFDAKRSVGEIYFSSSANGILCRDCEGVFADKVRIGLQAARCLNDLKLLAVADEKLLRAVEKVLLNHFTEVLYRVPKMAKYVIGNY